MGRYPFAGGIKHYLEWRKGIISESTLKEEDRKLRLISRDLRELKEAGEISTTDPRHMGRAEIQGFLLQMRRRGLDPSTQKKYLQIMKNYLEFFKNYTVQEMRSSGVKFPKEASKPITTLTTDEIWRILEATERIRGWHGSMSRGMVALFFSSGVRPKELRLARIEDLDLSRRRLYIKHPKGEGSWAGASYANLIRGDMGNVIRRYLEEREDHIREAGHKRALALFPNLTKGPDGFYSHNTFATIKAEMQEESGVRFQLRTFRPTLASETIKRDPSLLPAVSAQLRHSKIETTQRYYARVDQGNAGKQLEDVWREEPVIKPEKPVIDFEFDYTGYA